GLRVALPGVGVREDPLAGDVVEAPVDEAARAVEVGLASDPVDAQERELRRLERHRRAGALQRVAFPLEARAAARRGSRRPRPVEEAKAIELRVARLGGG